MPDLNDMLEGLDTPTYIPEEKKGAPQIEAPALDDILAPPPAAWTPQNAEKKGAPVVDEPVLLDDPAPTVWKKTEQKGAPEVEAPVLDDGPASYTAKPSATPDPLPDAASLEEDILGAATAYDPVEEFYQKLKFTDDLKAAFSTLDAEKQMQVVEMRAKQMGIPVPGIPTELRPKLTAPSPEDAAEEPVVLEEAPKPTTYVPKFKDEDLERAKEESKKPQKYTPPPQMEMTEEKRRENRRIMNELREEREKEAAKKGFKQLILLAVLGVICAVAFSVFISGAFGLGYKEVLEEQGFMNIVKQYAPYLGIALGLCSVVIFAPLPFIRGLAKLLNGVTFILSLFPGIPLLIQKDGNMPVNAVLFVVAAGLSGFGFMSLVTSDNIRMYDKHGNS